MKVTITVGYKKGDWHVRAGNSVFSMLKKDEKDVEQERKGELKLFGKSNRVTKKSLAEEFGGAIFLMLKKPGDRVEFEDHGFFKKRGIK